jgi:hypothetical protein
VEHRAQVRWASDDGSAVKAVTAADIRTDSSLILALDDPALFNYPIAFMSEPGFWNLTDREAEAFRAYLRKTHAIAPAFTARTPSPRTFRMPRH